MDIWIIFTRKTSVLRKERLTNRVSRGQVGVEPWCRKAFLKHMWGRSPVPKAHHKKTRFCSENFPFEFPLLEAHGRRYPAQDINTCMDPPTTQTRTIPMGSSWGLACSHRSNEALASQSSFSVHSWYELLDALLLQTMAAKRCPPRVRHVPRSFGLTVTEYRTSIPGDDKPSNIVKCVQVPFAPSRELLQKPKSAAAQSLL